MPQNPIQPLVFAANRGRWGSGTPLAIPDGYCEDAVNVEWWQSALGRKRPGLTALSMTNGPSDTMLYLCRHVPGSDQTVAEMWAVCYGTDTGTTRNIYRRSATGTWTLIGDVVAAFPAVARVTGETFNGKLFFSSCAVAMVWDGTNFRPVGVPAPSVKPAVADSATGGAYAATGRYYKVAFTVQAGSPATTIRRSELSPVSDLFTPDGAHTGAVVTMPALPQYVSTALGTTIDLATHWELYASSDNLTWFRIATTAVATTTFADTVVPSAYAGEQPPVVGTNLRPPAWTHLAVDWSLGRLLGLVGSRIYYTPVLGSLNVGDDERVPMGSINNYIDIGPNDGDTGTAISGSIDGAVYVFKRRHLYKLIKTGDDAGPYQVGAVSHVVGTLSQKSIAEGEDEAGRPCLYFASERGPYRIGYNGLEYLGEHIEDVWLSVTGSVLGDVLGTPALYYPARRQVWFWHGVYLHSLVVFTITNGGWTRFTGPIAQYGGPGGCLYSPVPASTLTLVPHIIASDGVGGWSTVYAYNVGATTDGGGAFRGYVQLPTRTPHGLSSKTQTSDVTLVAEATATAGVTIDVAVVRDFGAETNHATVSLTKAGTETHVIRKAEGAEVGEATAVQYVVGDAAASANAWAIDALVAPALKKEMF